MRSIGIIGAAIFAAVSGANTASAALVYDVVGTLPPSVANQGGVIHFALWGDNVAANVGANKVTISNFAMTNSQGVLEPLHFGTGTGDPTLPGGTAEMTGGYGQYSYTAQMALGNTISFRVTLEGPQLEGLTPVNMSGFGLSIVQNVSYQLSNGHWTGTALFIYYDANGQHILANPAFTVTQVVPEPAAAGMLATGALMLLARRKKRC